MHFLSAGIRFWFFLKRIISILLQGLIYLMTPPSLTKTPPDLVKTQYNVIFTTGARNAQIFCKITNFLKLLKLVSSWRKWLSPSGLWKYTRSSSGEHSKNNQCPCIVTTKNSPKNILRANKHLSSWGKFKKYFSWENYIICLIILQTNILTEIQFFFLDQEYFTSVRAIFCCC